MTPEEAETPEAPPILNAAFEFVRHAPQPIRSMFAGMPAKTLLSEGESLFRFLDAGYNATAYEFWLPLESYHHMRDVKTIPDWAIWKNPLSKAIYPTNFCRATLYRKAYAFKGLAAAAQQSSSGLATLNSSGLVWVPGLQRDDFLLRQYSY